MERALAAKAIHMYIIWKRRYIEGHQNDFPQYIMLTDANYAWMNKKEDATLFSNQRAAIDFLNKYGLEGATIENA